MTNDDVPWSWIDRCDTVQGQQAVVRQSADGEKVSPPREKPPFRRPVELGSGGLDVMVKPKRDNQIDTSGSGGEQLLRLQTSREHCSEIILDLDRLIGENHHAFLEAKLGLQSGTEMCYELLDRPEPSGVERRSLNKQPVEGAGSDLQAQVAALIQEDHRRLRLQIMSNASNKCAMDLI